MTEPTQKLNVARVLTTFSHVHHALISRTKRWRKHPDLRVASARAVLQSGQSSRLYQKLVKEKEMVSGVGGFMDEKRGVGAFYTNATLRPNVKTEDIEATIYAEIDRLKKEPIADGELRKQRTPPDAT